MSYEMVQEMKARYLEKSADLILAVQKASKEIVFPQNILVYKMASSALENADDDAVCKRIEDNYYFTEKLVNRLMYLAYLEGKREIDPRSFEAGASSAKAKFALAVRAMADSAELDIYPESDY